jgi:GT2 family glycosyltransferase
MAMRKEVFEMVGGFDEFFKTDFNDTDFCLKVREKGLRIVYNPHVKFIHYESKSCVRSSQNPEEVSEFKRRWNHVISNDPYYNPSLSRNSGDFSLAKDHLELITVRQ